MAFFESPIASEKKYLGDGVYVGRDSRGQLVTTTEDGETASNEIYWEPNTLKAFQRYLKGVA